MDFEVNNDIMLRKKILFFDTWIVGTKFTYKVAEFLKESFDVYYVSMDEMQSKSSKSIKDTIVNFKKEELHKYQHCFTALYDFSNFESSVNKMFGYLKPDIIISISLHNFEHRYINELAQYWNIPCIMFMHGIRSAETDIVQTLYYKKTLHYFTRTKYFIKIFFLYLKDIKSGNSRDIQLFPTFKRLFNLILNHSKFTNTPYNDLGINYHTIHILNERDKEYYVKNYGINESTRFIITSHADTIEIIDQLKKENNEISVSDTALFISQPYISVGLISLTDYEKAISYAKKVSDSLGLTLLIRPHPRDDFEVIDYLSNKYKIQKSNNDLYTDIFKSKIFIGFNSTFLYQVMSIGKPILFFERSLIKLPFFYKDYKKGVVIDEFNDKHIVNISNRIKNIIEKSNFINVEELRKTDLRYSILDTIKEILCRK